MQELFSLEIWELNKYGQAVVLYRTDFYRTEAQAKQAILDLETREVFAALYAAQSCEHPLFQFTAEAEAKAPFLIDDYAKAYFEGDPEVVKAVDDLLAWIRGERDHWVEEEGGYEFDFDFQVATSHLGEPQSNGAEKPPCPLESSPFSWSCFQQSCIEGVRDFLPKEYNSEYRDPVRAKSEAEMMDGEIAFDIGRPVQVALFGLYGGYSEGRWSLTAAEYDLARPDLIGCTTIRDWEWVRGTEEAFDRKEVFAYLQCETEGLVDWLNRYAENAWLHEPEANEPCKSAVSTHPNDPCFDNYFDDCLTLKHILNKELTEATFEPREIYYLDFQEHSLAEYKALLFRLRGVVTDWIESAEEPPASH